MSAVLSEAGDVKPLLWTEYFRPGEITFQGIENIASRVAGAVFLATPDDDSVIRERRIKTPRGNVLFEYGYLSAVLTRSRVALLPLHRCRAAFGLRGSDLHLNGYA